MEPGGDCSLETGERSGQPSLGQETKQRSPLTCEARIGPQKLASSSQYVPEFNQSRPIYSETLLEDLGLQTCFWPQTAVILL